MFHGRNTLRRNISRKEYEEHEEHREYRESHTCSSYSLYSFRCIPTNELRSGLMHLTEYDRALLAGERGLAARMAMSIIVRMAEIQGASELIDISQAHIDSTIYMGEAGLEF